MNRCKTLFFGLALALVVAASLVAWPSPAKAAPAAVNLIFIHHSVGSNWLSDGLTAGLNGSGYHVADITYGWTGGSGTVYGDHTDTGDWPTWFTNTVMNLVYAEMDPMSASNTVDPAPGANTIVMFKSCYPNSDVGSGIDDEKAVYNGLLAYFQAHPDKMFVLVTPPPMASISYPLKTRELANWLTDRDAGWLKDLTTGNVFVFDFYNVLTSPNAHHRMSGGVEVHEVVSGANTLYSGYHPAGDDHPNATGSAKAAAEFVPLLNAWYEEFSGGSGEDPGSHVLYGQDSPYIQSLGTWSRFTTASAYGGSYGRSSTTGASAVISFSGTRFDWIGMKGTTGGVADVYLDDVKTATVNLSAAQAQYKVNLWTSGTLPDGAHTVKIVRSASCPAGKYVNLDAVDIWGVISVPPVTSVRLEQPDTRITKTGTWYVYSASQASGKSYRRSTTSGASFTVRFNGTQFDWYGLKGPSAGIADVYLDGTKVATVNLYASSATYQFKAWTSGTLAYGAHTVRIVRSASSAKTRYLPLDAVDIWGTMAY